MSHLTPEALARLVDEAPTSHEAEHLAACHGCRTELDAMREDVQALAMLPDMAPAPDAWDALERRLVNEGVIRRRSFAFPVSRLAQLAAAIVVFVAGTAAGRMTAPALEQFAGGPDATTSPAPDTGMGSTPAPAGSPDTRGVPVNLASGRPDDLADSTPEPSSPAPIRPQPQRQSPISFASNEARLPQPGTLDEAAALLRQTEEWYLTALTRYAELTTGSEANDPIARLAALQSIVMTTQAALSQAPSDPVINGAHLTAIAQRDAALRQVAATSGNGWH
ncbi:MAG TPA: hypothetical protein VK929_04045 [Longimicrobiales bacterium]|nr:hypothetical protein [Longimicrobiales bacterium]